MTYVLFGFLIAIIGAQMVFHFLQTRDWREERAVLIQAVMARSLPEFHASIPREATVVREPWPEDYEIPVGM